MLLHVEVEEHHRARYRVNLNLCLPTEEALSDPPPSCAGFFQAAAVMMPIAVHVSVVVFFARCKLLV